MLKKTCLFLLIFSMVLSFCACNTNEVPQASSQSPTETETPVTTGNEYSNCPPIGPSNGSFYRFSDYQAYLESKNCELPLSDPKYLEAFGTVNRVNVWTLNSSDDFRVEFECTYRENDDRNDIWVEFYSISRFQLLEDRFSESAMLDAADIGEILQGNVMMYWIRAYESEEESGALIEKYYPNGTVPLRYQISDQIFVYYQSSDFHGIVFLFDDFVVRLVFGGFTGHDYHFQLPQSIVCPATRALLTKSTAPQAAEELYNLWKDAFSKPVDSDLETLIADTPSDHYESYPNQHGRPLSATLYKNGEVTSIDTNDPRLIRLVNFFNDGVGKENCAYIQSYLSWSFLERNVNHQDFRLELKYQPYGDKNPAPYSKEYSLCDTVVIADDMFVLINHEIAAYGDAERYPVLAAGFTPHSANGALWLDLFGF